MLQDYYGSGEWRDCQRDRDPRYVADKGGSSEADGKVDECPTCDWGGLDMSPFVGGVPVGSRCEADHGCNSCSNALHPKVSVSYLSPGGLRAIIP